MSFFQSEIPDVFVHVSHAETLARGDLASVTARVAEIDKLKVHHRAHLARLDALFASLQHRAFRGDLPAPSFSHSREKVASRSEVG